MAAFLALLLLHPGAKPPPVLNPVVGKTITLCVRAGMTPEQVVTVFGRPESVDGAGFGPPGGGVVVDCFYYRRYGVSVCFTRPVNPANPSHRNYIRVDGTLE